jgi:uncharacterized membrane protein HdeD (DUF308 family)
MFGIAAIAFGVLHLWPGLTLVTWFFFTVHSRLTTVCFSLVRFYRRPKPVPTWWLIVVGLLGIAAGAATVLCPSAWHLRDHRRDPAAQGNRQ